MVLRSTHRSRQCPHPGCLEWALLATQDEMHRHAYIWRCGSGHHGPRLLG